MHGQFASQGGVPLISLHPLPRGLDKAHHRLPASMHMDVLDRDRSGNMAIYGPSGLVHACLQTSCWVVQLRVQGELPAGFRVPVVGPTTTQAFWQFITWVSQATKQAVDV